MASVRNLLRIKIVKRMKPIHGSTHYHWKGPACFERYRSGFPIVVPLALSLSLSLSCIFVVDARLVTRNRALYEMTREQIVRYYTYYMRPILGNQKWLKAKVVSALVSNSIQLPTTTESLCLLFFC